MPSAKRLAFLVRPSLFASLFASLLACSGGVTKIGSGGDGGPNPECPSSEVVAGGGSCSEPGLQCPGTETYTTCGGEGSTTVQCTCTNGDWSCPVLVGSAPACPVNPVCPTPASITQGGYCTVDSTLTCPSTLPITDCNGNTQGYASCLCENSAWQCEEFGGPACEIDASAPCPDPGIVFAGQGCATYGTTCSGDPQVCDGTTVYDTLQCVGGVWSAVATTYCDADAGADAQFTDGGAGI
jgi:hypothetical protein